MGFMLFRRIIQKLSRDYKLSFLVRKDFEPNREYFDQIYAGKLFGTSDSRSGPGSDLRATSAIRLELPELFVSLQIKSIVDVPCGDLLWFSKIDLTDIDYLGLDIVQDLITQLRVNYPNQKFEVFDATQSVFQSYDLIVCRDLLVHLTTQQALNVIRNFRASGSKYLLATTFSDTKVNPELVVPKIGVGWRPLNLSIEPFDLGRPVQLINEDSTEGRGRYKDKSLGLWKLN